jgi:uncharacterized damage-inducible protein DinB
MNPIDAILKEMSQEAATTRRLLERVPAQHLTWKPHEKSMTMGRLATHIAEIPGWVSTILDTDGFDVGSSNYTPQTAGSVAELLSMFDKNVPLAEAAIRRQTLDRLSTMWRITKQGQVLLEMPRMGVIRTLLLNHLIHHRGQLSVYLRLKDVPLPSIYGPTADTPM